MDEFKHHKLESGRTGKKVKNPKQAIAIGLSEARRAVQIFRPHLISLRRARKKPPRKPPAKKKR